MKNKLILASAILALATVSSFANPNLLDSSWDNLGDIYNTSHDQYITDTPGALYDLSFDFTVYGTQAPVIYVYWSYNTLSVKNEYGYVPTTDGSVDVNIPGLVGTGYDELFINFEGNQGGNGPVGYETFSNFSLVEESSEVPDAASTSGLLGVGLLGLAALRRKLS